MSQVTLHPHQAANAQTLLATLAAHRAALDCSETGTGKSYTALAVAKALKLTPFVICPLSVGPGWATKFDDMGVKGGAWINYEKARRPKFTLPAGKLLLIWDECHRCKAANSKQAKLMARLAPTHPSLFLSATPFATPMETRALLHALGLVHWQRWFSYLPTVGCWRNPHLNNSWQWKQRPEDIATLRDKLQPYMVKTKWQDVEGFPDNVVHAETIRIKDKDKFDKLITELRAANKLVEQLRIRMAIEAHRVPAMVDMANDLLAQGVSPVAFFNFTEPLEAYASALDTRAIINGDTSSEDREKFIGRFQASRTPCPIVCNIRAGGEGIDLHDTVGVPRVSLVSPTWSAQDLKQALGRIHRVGAKSRAVQRILFGANTLESQVLRTVSRKLANINKLTDKDLAA